MFNLPKGVTYKKHKTNNEHFAYVFRDKQLGQLGRIVLTPYLGNTNIDYEVSGDQSDPMTEKRLKLFEPICKEIIGKLDSQPKSNQHALSAFHKAEALEPERVIENTIAPCEQCGHPTSMMVYAHDASSVGELEDYARMMYQKIQEVNVPTWILGEEKEININGELAGESLVLKVHPQREKAKVMTSVEFNKLLDDLNNSHCTEQKKAPANSAIDTALIGSKYIAWRGFLEGFFTQLLEKSTFPKQQVLNAAKALGILDDGMILTNNPSEQALFDNYCLFHYQIQGENWIAHCLKKKPRLLKGPYTHIGKALQGAYFTGLDILEVLDEKNGVMRVFDSVCKRENLFVDRAFCATPARHKDKMWMISTVVNAGGFLMTTGGGIPIDKTSAGGRGVLNILQKHINMHRLEARLPKQVESRCAAQITKTCLLGGALSGHTIQTV